MREGLETPERDAFEGELRRSVREEPPNLESPPEALRSLITPAPLRFLRCHFPVPESPREPSIGIGGAVSTPLRLSLAELQALPGATLTVTTECAGNDRDSIQPPVEGERWTSGAVSTAQWTGTSLRSLLDRAGLRETAVEIAFAGLDEGTLPDGSAARYERSLPVDKALDPDTIVAWAMNGGPIPREFGGPLRLVVPGWYGMASVKWLARAVALEKPFRGYFQADRYVYAPGVPVREVRLKSTFAFPIGGERLPRGPILVEGMVWGGEGGPARVDVEIDGAWTQARLLGPMLRHAWRRFELTWPATPGAHVLRCRATDASGAAQPDAPEWNELGYGANGLHEVRVEVE